MIYNVLQISLLIANHTEPSKWQQGNEIEPISTEYPVQTWECSPGEEWWVLKPGTCIKCENHGWWTVRVVTGKLSEMLIWPASGSKEWMKRGCCLVTSERNNLWFVMRIMWTVEQGYQRMRNKCCDGLNGDKSIRSSGYVNCISDRSLKWMWSLKLNQW